MPVLCRENRLENDVYSRLLRLSTTVDEEKRLRRAVPR